MNFINFRREEKYKIEIMSVRVFIERIQEQA